MTRMLFVNIAVSNLQRSMEFFAQLGFEYNRQFTDDKAACMVVNDKACFMLLSEPFFQSFTRKERCDTRRQTEGLFCISCASRAEVDDIVARAIAAGGSHAMPPQDHGFMYGWSFYDLDQHHWEVVWMDPSVPKQQS